MTKFGKFAPALIWRAFFLIGLVALGEAIAAVPLSTPPELAQIRLPDAAEIARILLQFRQTGVVGDYYLEFDLRALPRRGEERVYDGKMWGSRNAEGSITRVLLSEGSGAEQRLLVQNGGQARAWRVIDQGVVAMDAAELLAPIIQGTNLTAFDLQMPFLFWPSVSLEKLTRLRGRPAHVFVFRPPAVFASKNPGVGAVRAYLDAQYNAATQIETINPNGSVTKTLSLLDLKKVGAQWIPKSFEVRDEITRDKTRLVVTAAALGLALPARVFTPAGLIDPVSAPPLERIVKISQ